MVFVADDLGAWLVGLLADAGRKRLTVLVLGDEQERALRQAATAAVLATASELEQPGGDGVGHLAMVISQVFEVPEAVALAGQQTLLEGLQAGIAAQLAVLGDASVTGTGQSSAEVLGEDARLLAHQLAGHLLREIIGRGARGGPLKPLADQLNHDVTHLQGERLEGILADLTGVVRAAVAAADRCAAVRPVRLLPRPGFLAGREELLAQLDARLARADKAGPQVVALYGLGGVGKTSIAVEYAHRQLAGSGVVWQFAAGEPAALAAGFGDLAELLRPGHSADAAAVVHAALAASGQDWLLIFDNAPDAAAVRAMLPPAGRGRVLITSQSPHWPDADGLEVPVLDQEAAVGFLLERTGPAAELAAEKLAGELGGLPLALEQAAAYMLACGQDIAAYLGLFRQRRSELLGRGDPAGYDKRVATTWSLAFDQLSRTALGAVGLLRLLAFCAPELIPVRLLLQPRPDLAEQVPAELAALAADPLAADDAIAALRRFSLVSPPHEGTLSIHRLVQVITIAQMPDGQEGGWRQAACFLIKAALPGDPELSVNWRGYADLFPHALAALPPDSVAMGHVASFVRSSGHYTFARLLQKRIAAARIQSMGAEHPDTLAARANFASGTGEAGDAAAARDQFAALVPVFERVLGAEHRDTLIARGNLASWTGAAGDAATARDQASALVAVLARVSGADDRDTLTARDNLAHWTGEAGDAAAARDLYTALVPVLERVQGAEHPGTLAARANLAYYIGAAGAAAQARNQTAALVPLLERVLGAEHPDTLIARGNLARWTGAAGDAGAARDLFAVLVPVRERVSGAEYPYTLTARGNLARWTGEAGDAAAARDLFAVLVPVRERVSGAEHPDTLTARGNLARWTGEAGDAAAARDLFAELMPLHERVQGADHPDTVAVYANFAHWTRRASE